jgi:hypothetical protein
MTDDDWLQPDENAPELEDIEEDYLENKPTLGEDKFDTIKQISEARNSSEQRAGLVKNTDSGSTWEEDTPVDIKIPSSSIHKFENIEECICECHPRKKDCMHCYDHPEHLERKRKVKTPTEYNEAKIQELIEQDKVKQTKKHWWNK